MRASLVVPAAGSGTRFGGGMAKQLLPLAGEPVLVRSLRAFAGLVAEAVVPTSEDLRDAIERAVAAAALPMPVRVVAGGAERQDSVHRGLIATDPASDAVLVHDAVRPLVPRRCIEACLRALETAQAALVALPCAATVKRSRLATGRADLVDATVPRQDLWLAQTPQGFRRAAGLAAFARAAGRSCSDDAQVLELAGYDVVLVPGDAANLKITTPDDWAVAEAFLAARGGAGGQQGAEKHPAGG